ncbi:MAG: acetoacetate--CoA ligase [Bryobacter sp.]
MPTPQMLEFQRAMGFATYEALYRWSIEENDKFWAALRQWARLPAEVQAFNFAEELLRGLGPGPVLWIADEAGRRDVWTGTQLRQRVAAYQSWLRERGCAPGDRVSAYLPNWPETLALMLAATGLGAIWSSCSPDFGTAAVLDRFRQVNPRFLFSTGKYRFAGKEYALGERLAQLEAGLPQLEALALVEDLSTHTEAPGEFRPMPHWAPLFILFSSGTTGLPKCIVHSAGGALVQIVKELRLHVDVRAGEKLFYYTTCGWMMWNWLACGLAVGAQLVLYDGSPLYPGPGVLWEMAADWQVEHFGTSAKYLLLLEKSGYRPREHHELEQLRQVLSTGSPLLPHSFDFIATAIRPEAHIASISGGTDILSCFVLGNPLRPVVRGEIQGAGLGMDVQVWNEQGERVWDQPGELVCVNRFPSMPLGFWGDDSGEKYRAAYFEHFPGVEKQSIWRHGDWAQQNRTTDGFVIYGRSDATLNPGGIRIGTAEIYRVLEGMDEIAESVCVGQAWQGDTRIVLFVKLREGAVWSDELVANIKARLRAEASPHHVPKVLLPVSDIPRTVNGKPSEAAVRDAVEGRPIRNASALANPESTKEFQGRPELLWG